MNQTERISAYSRVKRDIAELFKLTHSQRVTRFHNETRAWSPNMSEDDVLQRLILMAIYKHFVY